MVTFTNKTTYKQIRKIREETDEYDRNIIRGIKLTSNQMAKMDSDTL